MTTISKDDAKVIAKQNVKLIKAKAKEIGINASVKMRPYAAQMVISVDMSKVNDIAVKEIQDFCKPLKAFWCSINIYNWAV